MKRISLIYGLLLSCYSLISQSNYELFKDYSAVYVPDENVTYFMEDIGVKTTENGENIVFYGLVGKLEGDYSRIIIDTDPSLRPVIKQHMKRKSIEGSTGNPSGVVRCIYNGWLCVILFPKKGIIEE